MKRSCVRSARGTPHTPKGSGGLAASHSWEVWKVMFSSVNTCWTLVAAALVFFMQAGFALCEAGFTRAKNTGNILMKNMMDFCIGTPCYWLIGFGLMFGGTGALIGGFDPFIQGDYSHLGLDIPLWVYIVFQTVFCATSATIVSGAMAERTKFLSYCVYSGVISALVYPIEAHWIWGGGWLSQLGFHDFAGSCCIHMVGGISAIIGAKILGPRIGKFVKDENGKVVKVNAFPGHSIPLGALGVFILWFGWYGFNGAACTTIEDLGSVFLTTTVSPAIATVTCMVFTWIKYGKPDVSMCLNASLAGLVAITASCDVTDAAGAIVIGIVAGLLVVFGVWLLDYKLHIDDPVGAVAVHMMNGIWGTIAVGLFATSKAPGYAIAIESGAIKAEGLFYGGGFTQLGLQLLGFVSVAAWAAVCMTIVFFVIKATIGLRATEEEEIKGLDICEHGLTSAYAGFELGTAGMPDITYEDVVSVGSESMENSVPAMIKTSDIPDENKITKVEILMKQERFEKLKKAMNDIGVTGMTVTQVLGCGAQKGAPEYYRGVQMEMQLLPKVQVEMVISKVPVMDVINAARKVLYTGHIGDGKIFVYDVENVVKVRTGETGYDALQGEDD